MIDLIFKLIIDFVNWLDRPVTIKFSIITIETNHFTLHLLMLFAFILLDFLIIIF